MSKFCRKSGSVPQKSRTGLLIGISAAAVVLLVLIGAIIVSVPDQDRPGKSTGQTTASMTEAGTSRTAEGLSLLPFPEALVPAGEISLTCQYQAPEIIIPANYRSLDYVVYLQCWTDHGSTDALVTVEIPGFTQVYEQKITVTRSETELTIHPPLVEGAAQSLNSSKEAQINVTVEDLNIGKLIVQDTRPIKLYSRYDMQWQDADGTPYYENILAWVTPEAPEIKQLLRLAADSCNELTTGQLNAIVGYQPVGDWTEGDITYIQVAGIMHALAAKLGVKYIMSPFSSTSVNLQRIATPAEVINTSGGLCAETAVTIASAIQATNMHAVLILLPGHMQVAVETWYDSGEYYLIETTALEDAANGLFENVINETMTQADWAAYMAEEGMVAIDCDLAADMNIQAID